MSQALEQPLTGGLCIVPANAFQFPAKAQAVQCIQYGLDSWRIQVTTADREVVALAEQRDEAQTEDARRGTSGDASVAGAGAHLPGCGQMARGNAVVASNAFGGNLQSLQMGIQ